MIKLLPIKSAATNFIKTRWSFLIFLLPLLLWVLLTYQSFGVSIDEPIEYSFGEMLYARNFGHDQQLIRDFAVEGQDSREIWAYNHFHAMWLFMVNDSGSVEVYHLLNLLFAIVAFYAAYEIIWQLTHNSYLSLLGPVVLFFTPRFLGDIAANVKDPVFATYYLLALLSIIIMRKKRWWLKTLIVGITFGLAASFRVIGYSLLLIFAINTGIDYLLANNKPSLMRYLLNSFIQLSIILVLMLVIHAIEMPFVASNPINNLWKLFSISSDYPWQGKMLYLGEIVSSTNLPWHYPLIWYGVTTPIFIIFFAILAHVFYKNRIIRLLLIALWVNIFFYIFIQPNIYDGIRHFLFLQVILSLLAAAGWSLLWLKNNLKIKILLGAVLSIYLLATSYQYINLHPLEYVYFNQLIGGLSGATNKFETDYWGLSYKQAADWLIENHDVKIIGLCGNKAAEMYFINKQIEVVWLPNCVVPDQGGFDYIIANQRNNDWNNIEGQEIYEVSKMGVSLVKVIQLSSSEQ